MPDQKWDLSRLDAGDLSALRRSAGQPEGSMAAWRAFYRACGHCDRNQEQYWFPAMCMDALWRETDVSIVKPMPECLRDMLAGDSETTDSLRHRIDVLLETPWSQDGYLVGKLMNLVRILKSRTSLKPDFQALADDLRNWNHDRHFMQRGWLRTIYNVKTNEEDEENAD